MDEKTFFFTGLLFIFMYRADLRSILINRLTHILNYYLNTILLFLKNDVFFDVTEIEEFESKVLEEKPVIKYEDKFLSEIRKLDKEFQFDEREKELLVEKETSFYQTTQNNCKNKIEEIKNRLCDIEVELFTLEKDNSIEEVKEEQEEEDIKEEEEFTKEEKIEMLTNDKSRLYLEIEKMNEILFNEKDLLDKAKEFALNFVINLRLEKLLNCFTIEMTPQGNVLMTYDIKKVRLNIIVIILFLIDI